MAEGKRMSEGLLRQRRNLIVVCILLWVMKYGGVSITKFSLAGFDISLQHPEILRELLWIAFSYFLFRYYQYFSSEGVSALLRTFNSSREAKCEPIIRRLVQAKYPDHSDNSNYSYATLESWKWIYHGQRQIEHKDYGNSIVNFRLPINRWKLTRGVSAAAIDTTFRNSVVTDYLLPFFLAGGIIWYCGANDWEGSFLRIFLS